MSFDFFPSEEEIQQEQQQEQEQQEQEQEQEQQEGEEQTAAPVYITEKMVSYTKPIVYYLCPENHKVEIYAKSKTDLFCLQCKKLIDKTNCTRMRDYANGTKVLRPAGKAPAKRYSHEYYLRRKNGLCKKQKNPYRIKNDK